MEHYGPGPGSGHGPGPVRKPSLSSTQSKDPETISPSKHSSRQPSTSFTIKQVPQQQDVPDTTEAPLQSDQSNQPSVPGANTVPALRSSTSGNLRPGRQLKSSATWSSSSGDLALISDSDEIEDRSNFVQEYNRLAKKHGVRGMTVGSPQKGKQDSTQATTSEKKHWWSRVLRGSSGRHQDHNAHHAHHVHHALHGLQNHHTQQGHHVHQGPRDHHGQLPSQPRQIRHRRSVSDLAMQLVQPRKDLNKTLNLQDMVRLSGKSLLYLPPEYAPGALILPTCFRATAQYLVHQGAVARGIFRVPGSIRVVNALFDYYCNEQSDEAVTRTIRCPTLPSHIKTGPHDVGSAFKKFLGALPGGVLGSLSLFDSFVAIHGQLNGEPELNRTRQTKIRARLIALAIGTVDSQFRRELICAVFGLLSLIGRQAEITPHEDEQGHPLPTSDLMGYAALGVVFGPLLVGDLLDAYSMKVSQPPNGLSRFPITPPQLKKERARDADRSSTGIPDGPQTVDKIHVANEITRMIITHWREVVRQLNHFSVLKSQEKASEDDIGKRNVLRSSKSDPFVTTQPDQSRSHQDLDQARNPEGSSTSESPTPASRPGILKPPRNRNSHEDILSVQKRRPGTSRSEPANRVSARPSVTYLSPTVEESIINEDTSGRSAAQLQNLANDSGPIDFNEPNVDEGKSRSSISGKPVAQRLADESLFSQNAITESPASRDSPSKQGLQSRILCQSGDSDAEDDPEVASQARESTQLPHGTWPKKRHSRPPLSSGIVSTRLKRQLGSGEGHEALGCQRPSVETGKKTTINTQDMQSLQSQTSSSNSSSQQISQHKGTHRRDEYVAERDPQTISKARPDAFRKSQVSTSDSTTSEYYQANDVLGNYKHLEDERLSDETLKPQELQASSPVTPTKQGIERRNSIQKTPKVMQGPLQSTSGESKSSTLEAAVEEAPRDISVDDGYLQMDMAAPTVRSESQAAPFLTAHPGVPQPAADPKQPSTSNSPLAHYDQNTELPGSIRSSSVASVASEVAEVAQRNRTSTLSNNVTPVKQAPGLQMSAANTPRRPGSVKALAAMWEGQSKESPDTSSARPATARRASSKTESSASRYRSHSIPAKSKSSQRPTEDQILSLQSPNKESSWSTSRAGKSGTGSKKPLRTSASDSTTLRQIWDHAGGQDIHNVELRPAEQPTKASNANTKQQEVDETLGGPLNPGAMGPHEEQPPVDKHISFLRPPVSVPAAAPIADSQEAVSTASGGNSILHAQIRNLQRQLLSRAEEVASMRRQLETHESMDIGVLSQQLREAKRESATWKSRAISAEKRVAVFKRFTARLRGLWAKRVKAHKQDIEDREREEEAVFREEKEMIDQENGQNPTARYGVDGTVDVAGSENRQALVPQISSPSGGADRTESMTGKRPTSSDGGAAAWWNSNKAGMTQSPYCEEERDSLVHGSSLATELSTGDSEIWRIVEDMLAFDGSDENSSLALEKK